jgi:hypothetical protein
MTLLDAPGIRCTGFPHIGEGNVVVRAICGTPRVLVADISGRGVWEVVIDYWYKEWYGRVGY